MLSFFTGSLFLTLSWTSGEIGTLVLSRWVLLRLLRKEGFFQKGFLVICGIIYVLSIWLHTGGKGIFVGWLDDYFKLGWIYPFLLWDYFINLWAVIEAIILCYVFRIYVLVKGSLKESDGKGEDFLVANSMILTYGVIFILIAIYVIYHYYAVKVYGKFGLEPLQLKHMLIFYRRIIGLFSIAFEGIMALLLFKVYFLFKRAMKRSFVYG